MKNECKLNLEWIPAAYTTDKSIPIAIGTKNEAETIKKVAQAIKTKSLYKTDIGLGKNKKYGRY